MIGTKLRLLREARGWSQSELATRTGINQPQISRYEDGRSDPSLEAARILAATLQVTIEDLFDQPLKVVQISVYQRSRPRRFAEESRAARNNVAMRECVDRPIYLHERKTAMARRKSRRAS